MTNPDSYREIPSWYATLLMDISSVYTYLVHFLFIYFAEFTDLLAQLFFYGQTRFEARRVE